VSKNLLRWVVGQDKALSECFLCLDEWTNKLKWLKKKKVDITQVPGPYLLLLGDPGTGKSLMGKALASHLTKLYKEQDIKLLDVICKRNKTIPSEPLIETIIAGSGKPTVRKIKRSEEKKSKIGNTFFKGLKYLMMGVGGCGELAKATRTLLNLLGLESRIVEFPGEDHVFIEVKLNGSWIVVDPGYSLNLVTREDRASRRIREMGGLSYVVAHTEYGIVDLTREYVSTDLIRIRVTYNGEPLANAKIALRHKFVGSLRSLPEVYTDINGTVNMYIGPISYNKTSVEPAEPFFWIYVNGMNTGRKVNSTSSGESHYIDIEMTEGKICLNATSQKFYKPVEIDKMTETKYFLSVILLLGGFYMIYIARND